MAKMSSSCNMTPWIYTIHPDPASSQVHCWGPTFINLYTVIDGVNGTLNTYYSVVMQFVCSYDCNHDRICLCLFALVTHVLFMRTYYPIHITLIWWASIPHDY